jgi:hypothetical protein
VAKRNPRCEGQPDCEQHRRTSSPTHHFVVNESPEIAHHYDVKESIESCSNNACSLCESLLFCTLTHVLTLPHPCAHMASPMCLHGPTHVLTLLHPCAYIANANALLDTRQVFESHEPVATQSPPPPPPPPAAVDTSMGMDDITFQTYLGRSCQNYAEEPPVTRNLEACVLPPPPLLLLFWLFVCLFNAFASRTSSASRLCAIFVV